VAAGASAQQIRPVADRIRLKLNPHPAGQLEHNVPRLDGTPLPGLQHKYKETVHKYLRRHTKVTDVLFTGGNPLVMRAWHLRAYIEPLLGPKYEHVGNHPRRHADQQQRHQRSVERARVRHRIRRGRC